jgi:hypothetical protein
MPLKHGTSPEVVSGNIKELIRAGHAPKQAVAAALAHKRKSQKMSSGGMAGYADGGDVGKVDQPKSIGQQIGLAGYEPTPAPSPAPKPRGYAEGGEVSEDMDAGLETTNDEEAERSLNQLRIEGEAHPKPMNPEHNDHDRMLARALYKKGEEEETLSYATGGWVEDGPAGDEPVGNKPLKAFEQDSELGEPLSEENEPAELGHDVVAGVPKLEPDPLDEKTREALRRNRANRRYSNYGQ